MEVEAHFSDSESFSNAKSPAASQMIFMFQGDLDFLFLQLRFKNAVVRPGVL